MATPKGDTDWSVFLPVRIRIMQLMTDGKTRSVLHVLQELKLGSNSSVRVALEKLADKGELAKTYEKVDRHSVAVFTLARSRSKRRSNRAALGG